MEDEGETKPMQSL